MIQLALGNHARQNTANGLDYVLALDDMARVGALRFRLNAESPFLAAATGKLPPLVRLSALKGVSPGSYTNAAVRSGLHMPRAVRNIPA